MGPEEFKKKVSRVFQEYFNEVLFWNFVVAWISSQLQLPEQKEGLLKNFSLYLALSINDCNILEY